MNTSSSATSFAQSAGLATEALSDSKNLLAATAAALAVLGVGTLAYSVSQSKAQKRKAQEIFLSKSQPNHKFSVEDDIPSFLRKQPRRVTLYFDENDELVDEATALADPKNYYHKYHAVTVDFGGSEEFGDVRDKITKDIFCSEKSTENAQVFLD